MNTNYNQVVVPTLETTMKALPTGIYAIQNADGTKSLGMRFMHKGENWREIIRVNGVTLIDNAPNRKWAENKRKIILSEIMAEGMGGAPFDIAKHFPDSLRLKRKGKPTSNDKIGPALSAWLERVRNKVQSTTARMYSCAVNQMIAEFGDMRFTDFTLPRFSEWVNSEIKAGKSLKTINNKLIPLRKVMSRAVVDGVIKNNPLRELNSIESVQTERSVRSGRKRKIKPFTLDEVGKILAVAIGQVLNMVQFGFATGLRLSELFAISWEDIDRKSWTATIRCKRSECVLGPTKTEGAERTIELSSEAIDALKRQMEYTLALPPFEIYHDDVNDEELPRSFVFYNPNMDEPWMQDITFRSRTWTTLLKRAGVAFKGPKFMRHTCASIMLSRGWSEKKVANYLGHTTTAMVQRNYGWIIDDVLRAAGGSQRPDLNLFNNQTDVTEVKKHGLA